MDDWLHGAAARLAEEARLDPGSLQVDEDEAARLLRVAAVAAHESGARTNAPLLCFLLGIAHGRSGRGLTELAEAVTGAGAD